ncbi:MAG: 50S ribosomal protein L32 [Mycoplasma sp.]|nr:50S ribosomal protein L32 [Mycoplasma sp.]
MAVPKRKTSKQRKRLRRSHHHLNVPNLVTINGEKVPHRLVNFYKRKDLQKIKTK